MGDIRRVHVIDDDCAMRESLGLLLETLGYAVESWDGSQPALERAEFLPGDLLLVDYRLGGCTGVDILRRIRKRGYRPPAIVMSGHLRSETADLDGALFLEKPFAPQALLDAIRKAGAAPG
ncbi:MAG TPA: response regulator [Rhizomicrobium sp.]|jgi:two-component system response regulator FixJ